jgi:hypothetical protein
MESIAGERLYLHVSRSKPKDANIRMLYEMFTETAIHFGIPFEIIRKKINVSHFEMSWEHEAFAYKNIAAATLSDCPVPTVQLTRSTSVNTSVNLDTLQRNIHFIEEVIARYTYGIKNPSSAAIFKRTAVHNPRFLNSWFTFLSTHSRATPYLNKNDPVINALSKTMQKYLSGFQRHDDIFVSDQKMEYKFYGNAVAKMHIYSTRSVIFDIFLLIPILMYLLAINVYFRGTEHITYWKTQVMDKIMSHPSSFPASSPSKQHKFSSNK